MQQYQPPSYAYPMPLSQKHKCAELLQPTFFHKSKAAELWWNFTEPQASRKSESRDLTITNICSTGITNERARVIENRPLELLNWHYISSTLNASYTSNLQNT